MHTHKIHCMYKMQLCIIKIWYKLQLVVALIGPNFFFLYSDKIAQIQGDVHVRDFSKNFSLSVAVSNKYRCLLRDLLIVGDPWLLLSHKKLNPQLPMEKKCLQFIVCLLYQAKRFCAELKNMKFNQGPILLTILTIRIWN